MSIIEGDYSSMSAHQRSQILERQMAAIREICGSIQVNIEEIMEDGYQDDEFLDGMHRFVGEVSLGTYDYVDEDGLLEDFMED